MALARQPMTGRPPPRPLSARTAAPPSPNVAIPHGAAKGEDEEASLQGCRSKRRIPRRCSTVSAYGCTADGMQRRMGRQGAVWGEEGRRRWKGRFPSMDGRRRGWKVPMVRHRFRRPTVPTQIPSSVDFGEDFFQRRFLPWARLGLRQGSYRSHRVRVDLGEDVPSIGGGVDCGRGGGERRRVMVMMEARSADADAAERGVEGDLRRSAAIAPWPRATTRTRDPDLEQGQLVEAEEAGQARVRSESSAQMACARSWPAAPTLGEGRRRGAQRR